MSHERRRDQIARRAAQLMYERQESEYYTAKRKAARQLGYGSWIRTDDLPKNRTIRDYIELFADAYEGDARRARLEEMRMLALRMMRRLEAFHPHLIGSVLTGHVRAGSDVDLHVFSGSVEPLLETLESYGIWVEVERKRVRKFGEETVYTHLHLHDRVPFELTMYPRSKRTYVFKSSITGKGIEVATIAQLEELMRREHPEMDLEGELAALDQRLDDLDLFRLLLQPLCEAHQNPRYHPEGNALYHSLQVFELARRERPWDEEFLLAALLHDVGKAIDPANHVQVGVEAIEHHVSERTRFLVAHHMEALAYNDRTLGKRARRRLTQSEHFDDLMLLRELDEAGRVPGIPVCDLDEALDHLRRLREGELDEW